ELHYHVRRRQLRATLEQVRRAVRGALPVACGRVPVVIGLREPHGHREVHGRRRGGRERLARGKEGEQGRRWLQILLSRAVEACGRRVDVVWSPLARALLV